MLDMTAHHCDAPNYRRDIPLSVGRNSSGDAGPAQPALHSPLIDFTHCSWAAAAAPPSGVTP